jgi:hypothetical protein
MSLTKVSYSMINGAISNILDFGAVMDSSASADVNTTALNRAIAVGGTIYIPIGTLYINPITLGTPTAGVDFTLLGSGQNTTTITGDGNLFTLVSGPGGTTFESLTLKNNLVNGFLIYYNTGAATNGITFRSVTFGKATRHIFTTSTSLLVNQYIYDCRFSESTAFSRQYDGGAYACHEFNTYSLNTFGGLFINANSFGCSVNNSIFESCQAQAVRLDTNGIVPNSVEGCTFNSCYFEACALANPATTPYISLASITGQRLLAISFNNCSFMLTGTPVGLAFFVIISENGGTVRAIFNGGQVFDGFGTAAFCSNTTSATFTDFTFNSGGLSTNQLVTPEYQSYLNNIVGSQTVTGVQGASSAVQATIGIAGLTNSGTVSSVALIMVQGDYYNGVVATNTASLIALYFKSGNRIFVLSDTNNGSGSNQGFVATYSSTSGPQIIITNKAAMTNTQSGNTTVLFLA